MIRRAALAASLLFMLSTASASASSASITISDNHFSPTSVTVSFGDDVSWSYPSGSSHHTSTSNVPVSSWGSLGWNLVYSSAGGPAQSHDFHQAGAWLFHCAIHGSMRGTVNVKPVPSSTNSPLGSTFMITLGDQALPSGFIHDIQKRKVGGAFKTWKSTAGTGQTWKPAKRGTWEFRVRTRNTSNGTMTDYSPTISITVS
jgi:plastocyanin